MKQFPAVYWLTGLSGAGKSTIASMLERWLLPAGYHTMVLDGDTLRSGISSDLGFTDEDRIENIKRAAHTAAMMADAGLIVIVCLISPFKAERERAKEIIGEDRFFEVHIDCDLEACIQRDVKGLYKKALDGEIKHFTGVSSPYEAPEVPDVHLNTAVDSPQVCVESILEHYFIRDNATNNLNVHHEGVADVVHMGA